MTRRAVVVSPEPGNEAGGTERLCTYVAGLLGRLGFDVALVGPNGRGPGWVQRHGASTLWQAASARRACRALGPAELVRPRARGEARRRLGLAPDGRYALFVGRGEPGKGPGVALEACRSAGYELLAAGTRPIAGSLPLGVLRQEELAWAYAAADTTVMPTRYEGFGYVVVESLACGIPVVTTPTGWARELAQAVPEYRPFLVAPEKRAVASALARAGSGGAEAAVGAARAHVLAHHTLDAFERRWTAWLAESGVLG